MTYSGAILAGGLSRRFGTNKALFLIEDTPMIRRIYDRLCPIFETVMVAGGDTKTYGALGLPCRADLIPGKGALSGLYTALSYAPGDQVFCFACDMPLINASVVRVIISHLGAEEALLPVIGGVHQPLHAVYRKSILPAVEHFCRARQGHMPELLKSISVRYLDDSHFAQIPEYYLSFINFNDPQTIEQYRSHLR
jgi:molybdopterin-guanine dinucleotide biosynthesis protein A